MVLAILLTVSLGSTVAQERTLFEQVFATPPKATNGFADYVRAADALRANRAVGRLLAGEGDLTPLERNRRIAQEGKTALDLMRSGNLKPVEDPRAGSLSIETYFPELAGFKQLAKVAAADMAYRYATGDSRGATDTFVETAKFVSRFVASPTLIGALVLIACDSILLAPFEQNLARVALADLERLERTAGERVASVEFLKGAMEREGQFVGDLKEEEIAVFLEPDDEDEDYETALGLKKTWDAMSATQRQNVIRALRDRVRSLTARAISVLSEPESAWKPAFPEPSAKPTLVDYLVDQLAFSWPDVFTAFAKNRTQWRLLRLHVRIERFRLVHGKLPNRLDEAASPDLATDPWNDGPFDYKVLSRRDYELTSKGDATTGPIAILYRRPPRADDGKNEPPPP